MIQHIALLKVTRVIYEIIVNGVVIHLDIQMRYDQFEIYGLNITGTWIYLLFMAYSCV